MKKLIIAVALCLIAVMALTAFAGCKKSDEKKFIGTWYELDEDGNKTGTTLVLAKKGEGSITEEGMSGSVKWSVEKNKLFLTMSVCGMTQSEEFTYKFSGKKLILTDSDGDTTTYTK